jgi:hypothetical protein
LARWCPVPDPDHHLLLAVLHLVVLVLVAKNDKSQSMKYLVDPVVHRLSISLEAQRSDQTAIKCALLPVSRRPLNNTELRLACHNEANKYMCELEPEAIAAIRFNQAQPVQNTQGGLELLAFLFRPIEKRCYFSPSAFK